MIMAMPFRDFICRRQIAARRAYALRFASRRLFDSKSPCAMRVERERLEVAQHP
jgi:hypothetical protein